jgi:hypothetical protein
VLVSIRDIADLFGVERRTVHRWKTFHRGFPKHVAVEAIQGERYGGFQCLYRKQEVLAWAVLTGRWDPIVEVPTSRVTWPRGRGVRCECCEAAS